MKKTNQISAAFAAVCIVFTAFPVQAVDVKLVSNDTPWYSFLNIFSRETSKPTVQSLPEANKVLTANPGTLTVIKNNSTDGVLSYRSDIALDVSFVIATPPTNGEITITDNKKGSFNYIPNANIVGSDSFTFKVTAETEEAILTDGAEVTIEIKDKPSEQETTQEPEAPNTDFHYEDMFNHWGEYSAIVLANRNILKGISVADKYYFYPDELLTRADFTVLLMSALDIDIESQRETASPFADAADIPAWANLYAKAAHSAGIIEGVYENGSVYFRPYDVLTRIEAVKILDKAVKPEAVRVNQLRFSDSYLIPEWGREAVQNMSDYGIIKGYDDNTIRPYVKINRAMAAEFILQIMNYENENPSMLRNIKAQMNGNDILK